MPIQPEMQVSAQPADMEAVVADIWTEYEDSLLAGDSGRWIAQWAEDGVQMPPGALPVEGKEAIAAGNRAFLEQFEWTEFEITNLEVQAADGWAYARGLYTATYVLKAGGDPVQIEGKYTTILQKQPDGSWKLYRDIFNSNAPPPAPAEEDVEAAINSIWREYESSLIEGDADRWIALWAEGGVQMPPGTPLVDGRDVIDAKIHAELEAVEYPEFAITLLEVIAADGWAIARGVYSGSYRLKDGSDAAQIDGKYMTLFQKQPDGSWKIYRDIFNSNVP
jgi:uncharacterized protein (TIGR02246 family)